MTGQSRDGLCKPYSIHPGANCWGGRSRWLSCRFLFEADEPRAFANPYRFCLFCTSRSQVDAVRAGHWQAGQGAWHTILRQSSDSSWGGTVSAASVESLEQLLRRRVGLVAGKLNLSVDLAGGLPEESPTLDHAGDSRMTELWTKRGLPV